MKGFPEAKMRMESYLWGEIQMLNINYSTALVYLSLLTFGE